MMGYNVKDGLPMRELAANTCALCDSQLLGSVRMTDASVTEEKIHILSCKHQFHGKIPRFKRNDECDC